MRGSVGLGAIPAITERGGFPVLLRPETSASALRGSGPWILAPNLTSRHGRKGRGGSRALSRCDHCVLGVRRIDGHWQRSGESIWISAARFVADEFPVAGCRSLLAGDARRAPREMVSNRLQAGFYRNTPSCRKSWRFVFCSCAALLAMGADVALLLCVVASDTVLCADDGCAY